MHWRMGHRCVPEPLQKASLAPAGGFSCVWVLLVLCLPPTSRSCLQGCLHAGLALILQWLFYFLALTLSCERSCPGPRPVCSVLLGLDAWAMARPLNIWYLRSDFILYIGVMLQEGSGRSRSWGWTCICCNLTNHELSAWNPSSFSWRAGPERNTWVL